VSRVEGIRGIRPERNKARKQQQSRRKESRGRKSGHVYEAPGACVQGGKGVGGKKEKGQLIQEGHQPWKGSATKAVRFRRRNAACGELPTKDGQKRRNGFFAVNSKLRFRKIVQTRPGEGNQGQKLFKRGRAALGTLIGKPPLKH